MADTNELKPCPFCGGEAYARERTCDKDTPYNPNDRAYPVVRCSKCFTTVAGKDWTGVSTAIEVWNKRADSTQPADAALAEAEIDRIAQLHVDVVEVLHGVLSRINSNGGYIGLDGQYHKVVSSVLADMETINVSAALRARAVPANPRSDVYTDVITGLPTCSFCVGKKAQPQPAPERRRTNSDGIPYCDICHEHVAVTGHEKYAVCSEDCYNIARNMTQPAPEGMASLFSVVESHIADLGRCVSIFRSSDVADLFEPTSREMELAAQELSQAIAAAKVKP